MKKILYIVLIALCVACTPNEPTKLYLSDADVKELIKEGTCLTIEEFKATYMTEKGNFWSDTSQYRLSCLLR